MKKLLLTTLLAAGALASQADYKEHFHMTYKGQEIANGSTIVCTDYETSEEWVDAVDDMAEVINFDCELATVVTAAETQYAEVSMFYSNPTATGFTEKFKSGSPSICSNPGSCFGSNTFLENNCGYSGNVAFAKANPIGWLIHLNSVLPNAFTEATFLVKFTPMERENDPKGDWTNPIDPTDQMPYNLFPYVDSDYSFYITFKNSSNSVSELGAADAAPVYYNLQGVRVSAPEEGLYIVRRGNKVTKELIRK